MKFFKNRSWLFWAFVYVAVVQCCQAKAGSFDCETDGSYLDGNTYYACGVGEGATEGEARLEARMNAKKDYLIDHDHTYSITHPMRTSCSKIGSLYKCYQLTSFRIVPKPD
jgi:hypothetical protein